MSKRFFRFISIFIVFQLGMGPALAQGQADNFERTQRSQFDPHGLSYDVSSDNMAISLVNKNQESIKIVIPFSKIENLREESPLKLNKKLMLEMKNISMATKAGVTHSTIRLLPESAMFFTAMGSVVALQLFRDYAQNPVGLQQFLEHQLSPVGTFSFWTFMATQGAASNVMSMYLKNPKFQIMIPYLGMTVGFAAQSFAAELISDPNVWACSKVMMGLAEKNKVLTEKQKESGLTEDPCLAAHEHFILTKKINQYAPGFVSMMLASAGAAGVQSLAVKGATQISGVDVALWLAPGAMEVKGLKLVLINGAKIGLFVHIQALIDRSVTLGWKNMIDSRLMIDSTVDLVRELNRLKKNQWATSDQDLKEAIAAVHEKMGAWRMANLAEVYEAHNNWSESIAQLQSMYQSTYAYYSAFINEVRKLRFHEHKVKLLERPSPFVGVIGQGVTGQFADLYFSSPQTVEETQLKTIDQLILNTEKDLKGRAADGLTEPDKQEIQSILKLLKSEDLWEITKGFAKLSNATYEAYGNWPNDRGRIAFLEKMKKTLGNPQPARLPGEAFNRTYLLSPTQFETVKDTAYYRHVGTYTTEHITEYLMMQMICGPDLEKVGQSSIKMRMGFPSVFLPPQIKEAADSFLFCKSPFETPSNNTIYNAKVNIGNKTYKGFPAYLIQTARSSIVGDQKASRFPDWWEEKTEKQMQQAFALFQDSYQEIVIKMIDGVFKTEKDRLNLSPFANGTMQAAFQEEKIYLSILQDLLKPEAQYKLDIDQLLNWTPTQSSLNSIDEQFKILSDLIHTKIKVVTLKDNKKVIQSVLKNSELTNQLGQITKQLNSLAEHLGVNKDSSAGDVRLNKAQKELALSCLEKLQTIALEITNYGSIASIVSWRQLHEVVSDEEKEFNNKQAQASKKMQNARGPIKH